MSEEGVDFRFTEFERVPLAMEEDVAPDPVKVGLLRAETEVSNA